MANVIIKMIELYQNTPMHAHSYCRFKPTCSEYMKESIKEYGTLRGLFKGIKRILRCNPFGGYGYDPVKKKELD